MNMKIFQISDKRFAIGNPGKKAAFVVDMTGRPGHGGKIVGVRGVKPVLDDRFTIVAKPTKALVDHFEGVL
jgi:hypothetical protein